MTSAIHSRSEVAYGEKRGVLVLALILLRLVDRRRNQPDFVRLQAGFPEGWIAQSPRTPQLWEEN